MVLRILLALFAVWLIWTFWRKLQPPRPSREVQPPVPPEAMHSCAECGVHLPASLAYPGRGGVFCSAEHREQFESRRQP